MADTLIRRAADEGAQLACLPEMATTGYFALTDAATELDRFTWAEPVDGPAMTHFQSLAQELAMTLVVPWFERAAPGEYYNSAAVLGPDGGLLGCYRKVHTAWSGTAAEKFYVRPGHGFPVIDTPVGRIGLLICYDRDFPEAARTLGLRGAEFLCLPTASSQRIGPLWERILSVRAYENQIFVVAAAMTGPARPGHEGFNGRSTVIDPFGEALGTLDREPGVLVVDADLTAIERARTTRFLYRDRRPELYGEVTNTGPRPVKP